MHSDKSRIRRIPLDKETFELMKMHLYHSDILQRYLFPHTRDVSEYDLIRQTVEILEKAKISKQFIYAYIRTRGLLVTEENQKFVSVEDMIEWATALREYDRLTESGALRQSDSLIPFIKSSRKILNPKKSRAELKHMFDARNFHKLIIGASRKQFLDYDFPGAIFSAYKKVLNTVKVKSGNMKEDGKSLVTSVFNPKDPILQSNSVIWTQDTSIQEGVMYLFMGAVLCVRNVFAHKDVYLTETDSALEYLSFASFLCKILDATQKRSE